MIKLSVNSSVLTEMDKKRSTFDCIVKVFPELIQLCTLTDDWQQQAEAIGHREASLRNRSLSIFHQLFFLHVIFVSSRCLIRWQSRPEQGHPPGQVYAIACHSCCYCYPIRLIYIGHGDRNRQNSEWAMTSVVSADSTEFGVDDLCAVGPDIYLTNSSCEVDTIHNNNNNNNDDDGDSSSASPVKRDGLFSAPIFERSFQWTRRESKYRLDNNSSNVYSSDNSSSNNNNNGNEVVPIGMAMAQSPRHSSSLTWRGSASFRLAPSSSFFSKMHSPSRQLHHRNHQHHQHHHHHNLPHDDSSDDFPVETGFSVVVVGPDDSSNQPSSSPRRKLKHAFSSSYLFKSRNLHSSSRYNLKKKKSTHENLLQEIRGLRLLTCTGTGTGTGTTTTVGRKEPVSTSCRIVQGDVIDGEHGSIGILHAKVIKESWYIYIVL